MKKIAIIIPVYNEHENILILLNKLNKLKYIKTIDIPAGPEPIIIISYTISKIFWILSIIIGVQYPFFVEFLFWNNVFIKFEYFRYIYLCL